MKRNAIQELVTWKSSEDRKPMVLKGARQVGKTWLMKEFGQNYYDSYVYFNFDEEDELKSIFETNKNPQRIIELLSLIAGEKILPGDKSRRPSHRQSGKVPSSGSGGSAPRSWSGQGLTPNRQSRTDMGSHAARAQRQCARRNPGTVA